MFDDDLPYVQTFGNKEIVAIPLGTDVNDMPFMKYGNAPRTMLDSFNENVAIAKENGRARRSSTSPATPISSAIRAAPITTRRSSRRRPRNPDVWIGTRAQIAHHVLAQKA